MISKENQEFFWWNGSKNDFEKTLLELTGLRGERGSSDSCAEDPSWGIMGNFFIRAGFLEYSSPIKQR